MANYLILDHNLVLTVFGILFGIVVFCAATAKSLLIYIQKFLTLSKKFKPDRCKRRHIIFNFMFKDNDGI